MEFARIFNTDYPLRVAEARVTIIQAVYGNTPSLGKVANTLGPLTAKSVLQVWLDRLNDFYGKGSLISVQIEEISTLILSEYYYLRMSELAIFFNRLKLGKYGSFYGAIDPMKITSGLCEFICERNAAIDEYKRAEREKFHESRRIWEEEMTRQAFTESKPIISLINTLLEITNKLTNKNKPKYGIQKS